MNRQTGHSFSFFPIHDVVFESEEIKNNLKFKQDYDNFQ